MPSYTMGFRGVASHSQLFELLARKRPDPKIGYLAPIFNILIRLFHLIRAFHLDSGLFSSISVSHARWLHMCLCLIVSSANRVFHSNNRVKLDSALESPAIYPADISIPNTLNSSDNVLRVSLVLTDLSCSLKMRILRRIHLKSLHSHQQTINER